MRDDEFEERNTSVQDLLPFSTLLSAWAGYDRHRIADSLADVLLRTLNLDFVYVRVAGIADAAPPELAAIADADPVEVARTSVPPATPDPARVIGQALAPWIDGERDDRSTSIPHPLGPGMVQLAVIPLDCGGAAGVLAAGSRKPSFPADTDHRLATAICSQAAALLQIRQAEELARHRETRWRALIDKSWDGLVLLDGGGRGVYASLAVKRILGYDASELVSQEVFELIHPEDRTGTAGCFSLLLAQPGRSATGEFRFRHRDGAWRWLEATGTNRLDDPDVQGIVVNYRDITERRQAVALLLQHREAERGFAQQLVALHEVTNQLFRAASVDDLCRQAVELGRSRLEFDRLGIWFCEEGGDFVRGSFGVDENGQLRDERGRRRAVDRSTAEGQVLTRRLSVAIQHETPLANDEGEEVGRSQHAVAALWNGEEAIGLVSTDNLNRREPITDSQCQLLVLYASALGHLCSLKRMEEARRESEGRFRQLTENIRQVFWMRSADRDEIIYVSPTYEEVWERTCASLYAEPCSWLEAVHPKDQERVRESLSRAGYLGHFDLEYRLVRPNGTIRWIWDRGFPVLDEAGRLYRLAGIAEDITERKETEELKTTLLSAVSHDLQTPLVSLLTSLANLRRHREARWWANHGPAALAGLEEEAQRLYTLTRDLLDLSHLESGQWQPAWEIHDLVDLLGSVLGRLEAATAARVRVLLPETLPAIRVDGMRIAQVLWNLLDNALKYSPPEAPVEFSAKLEGERLWVAVRDEGPGVPPPEQSRIFDRFYRSTAASGAAGDGLGLGLAICRELVEAHGGRIWVESDVASGATFVFTLPLGGAAPEVGP